MTDSLWRQPYLVELSYAEIHRLVFQFVPQRHLRILDAGCGTGFLSLELARHGHDVVGADSDERLLSLATRTKTSDPFASGRGNLEYVRADLSGWEPGAQEFDVVIFSRVLHHLQQPDHVLDRVRRTLGPGGKLICVDFAYDCFGELSAAWLYQTKCLLHFAGWYQRDFAPSPQFQEGVSATLQEWAAEYRDQAHLNRAEDLLTPLDRLFDRQDLSWHPYLFWDLLADSHIPEGEVERRLANWLQQSEQYALMNGMPGVLFRYVGERR